MKNDRWTEVRRLTEEALGRSGAERDAFLRQACTGDDELRREVEALLAADAEDDGRFDTPAVALHPPSPPLPTGTRLGPWELGDEIASGGMGTVHRARRADGAFEREVAVKVVKRGLDTDEILARFERERRVLASLEHPHIARLFDAGSTDDGRPWLAMEYVEGRPIDEHCEAAGLSARGRVALFRDVCAAVDHAHRHLVVHRDLKPGNILVTPAGAPKLLDFGIAKMLDPHRPADATATIGPGRMLTPEYASPEQIRGEPISTASDVYSLGVVLYEVLTGRRPHRLTDLAPADAARAIEGNDPSPPSAVADPRHRAALVGDLDTIVLQALHRDPERRYGSAAELAEDLGRHLSGLPVRARHDTWAYRTTRFCARHRVGVSVAALLMLSLTVGLAVSWSLYVETRELADSLEEARGRAQARFDDVHALTETLLADLNGALAPVTGAMEARELIVETGLEYLERLARDGTDDERLAADVALGYLRIADIQGSPQVANLGRTADARASVAKALALAEGLVARRPDDPSARLVLATALVADVELARVAGDGPGFERLERAQSLCPAVDEVPESTQRIHGVRARLADALGHAAMDAGRLDEAHAHFDTSVAHEQALLELRPDAVDGRRLVAMSRTFLGRVDALRGDPAESERHYRAALDELLPLVASHPDHRLARRGLSVALSELGAMLSYTARRDEGVELLSEALVHSRRLADASPSDLQQRRDVLVQQLKLAPLLVSMGRAEESLPHAEEAVALADELATKDPDSHRARSDLGIARQVLTRSLNASGRSERALAVGEAALADWRAMAEAAPADVEVQRNTFIMAWDLAMVARSLAREASDDLERRRRWEQARDLFQESHDRAVALRDDGRLSPRDGPIIPSYAADVRGCEDALRALRAEEAGP